MYKLSKLIITVIVILSIICCVPAVSAIDTTEPTEAPTEAPTEKPTEAPPEQLDNHNSICCILLAIGVPSGCLMAQGFSFWKW